MKLKFLILLASIIVIPLHLFTQVAGNPTSSPTLSSWVSISNEYITIAMETNTGRYLLFDNEARYSALNIDSVLSNNTFLKTLPPLPAALSNKPSVLGKTPDALNFTTLNINSNKIIFGSSIGSWITSPIIESNKIIYAWKLGDLEIIQTLSIATNIDTQFKDALTVEYTAINNSESTFSSIETRAFIDPSVNEYLDVPFFLLDNKSILNEQEFFKSTMPKFWLAADPSGNISSLSIKSFLKAPSIITPNTLYLTSTDRALRDIWNFTFNPRNRIAKKDSVVLMYFDQQDIPPTDSRLLASFQISKPALMNTFQNNGLEVRASSFSTKNTSPMLINVWILNTTNMIYDTADLTLIVPEWLTILDGPTKRVTEIGNSNIATPVSWNITSLESVGRTADIKVLVEGKQNGIITSRFEAPITVNLVPDFQSNNQNILKSVAKKTVAKNIITPKINLESFLPGDTAGATTANLNRIYQKLKKIKSKEAQEIVKLIETENELIKEIEDTEKTINEINNQYQILLGIYQNLYEDKNPIDYSYFRIEEISDKIKKTQHRLKQQESVYSNTL
ncbi:MAG: hypothetical protein ACRCTJ_05660 [Brevinema sp.]